MTSGNKHFTAPTPSHLVMKMSGVLNEWALLFGIPFVRKVPLLRDIPPFGGYFKVSEIIISREDTARLREFTNPKNAFFFGPNHPEFTTDWLIDKHISTRFAPRMSSWAASSIIRGPLAPFWSANNLIGNDGGAAAKEYSINCALAGHGTLLHPEGSVRWRSDKIFDLLPGIADMAIDAAKASAHASRKVYIIPLVWKIVYKEDVQAALNRGITILERTLGLPDSGSHHLGKRYVILHQNLLQKQMLKFGFSSTKEPTIQDAEQFFEALLQELQERYSVQGSRDDIHRLLHRLYRASREAKSRRDGDAVMELQRLAAYSKDTFEKNFFYQEEIGEGIQFIRQIFLTGGYDSIRSMLPKPFGWRNVYLTVPEPIEVSSLVGRPDDSSDLSVEIMRELKERMDSSLGELNKAFEKRVKVPIA